MNNRAKLKTYAENTWCPGCGNFAILNSVRKVFSEFDTGKLVMVSGIGCHGKIVDYVNVNSFYSIHGRVPAAATGIKLGNSELTVVGFAGDGDAYGEGLLHLIFAAKRNVDITIIVHNNRVYALTTGQFTPTSPEGFRGKSTPFGSVEKPFNPLLLMLDAGATFIARSYSNRMKNLQMVIKEGIEHKGFSFIEVLQPCYTYFNTYEYYNERVYEIQEPREREEAEEKIKEWDYNSDTKIPIGIFYREKRETYEDSMLRGLNPSKLKTSGAVAFWNTKPRDVIFLLKQKLVNSNSLALQLIGKHKNLLYVQFEKHFSQSHYTETYFPVHFSHFLFFLHGILICIDNIIQKVSSISDSLFQLLIVNLLFAFFQYFSQIYGDEIA